MPTSTDQSSAERRRHGAPMRLAALAAGVVYLLLGVIGFFVPGNAGSTSAGPFGTHATQYSVLIFSVSPLLNALHTLVGVLGVVAARKVSSTAIYALAVAIGFAGFSAYSVLVVSVGTGDRFNLNWADVILHLVTMAGAAVVSARSFRTVRAQRDAVTGS
ncbi:MULTISPECIES: DUF4383 domain-containing protein [unclassified Amycolatopsis]|uniref:DUF4383 domain-containing protein n=1 Tax=unclassified Amycolatopsis TaxID=2618356 RepID=UPI002E105AA2|nr:MULTISPECIES: DUF4383 domain-containing protein [unclassified Amycolatopsis]WSK76072.1 DUF4383 domain-containing protein [Amycolatopsis sp. NBC_01286]